MSYQPKVYKKAGGDELVVASGGKITIESGGELDIESLTNGAPGAGISGGTGTVFKSSVVRIGDIIRTSILIYLTGLSSSATDGDIIGQGTAAAYLGQITAAKNGTILSGRMTCLEVPTGGADDIDLYSAAAATGVFDAAISTLSGSAALVTSGAAWTLGGMKALSAVPAANAYLYLTGGEASAGTYTAGKFLIELDGYEA